MAGAVQMDYVPGLFSAAFFTIRRTRLDASADLADLWLEISEAVSKVVDRVTFGELVTRARERRSRARPMYHI